MTSEVLNASTDLVALRRFDGAPTEFWRRYLAALGALTDASALHLYSPDVSARWRRLATWTPEGITPSPPSERVLDRLTVATGGPSPADSGFVLLPLTTGDETQRVTLIFQLAGHPDTSRLTPAIVAADVPRDYLERRRSQQQTRDVSLFAATLDLLLLLNRQTKIVAAAMLVCNELAARHACERVSLGWIRDHQANLMALSHADKFDRRTEAVRALELAMEECADQNEEIVVPPENDPRQVKRDHAAFVAAHAPGHVVSIPLRVDDDVCAVLLCERQAAPFSADDVEALRVTCDQISRRLADLHAASGGIVRQSLARTRSRLARWAGPTHTWWKVGGVCAAVLLLFGLFGRLPHRITAPSLLRSDQVAYVTAPFDAFLYAASAEPGDTVAAGHTLFSLDTRDLLLEESAARANLVRHEREAERARAADALGEMRIAEAMAEQARAQLEQTRWRLSRAEVKSPFAGSVVEGDLKRRIGAPVRAGDVLMQVARLDTLFFDVQVAERDINHVSVGVRVRVAFTSQPDLHFVAAVERIEPSARSTPQGAIFVARCRLVDAPAPWWRPGMGGVAKIDAGWRMPLWIVTHRTVEWLRLRLWW
jgi:multidrug resistance efflux pump